MGAPVGDQVMCGLFGIVGRHHFDGMRDAALTLKHRGPDGFGEWSSVADAVYLGHCRLSIIDISDAGRQPMANEDGNVQVVFNGEIYNFAELRQQLEAKGHTFRSNSDTEVIVHGYEQWGENLVDRLRGIFAFGIWDRNQKQLLLARDRLGVKPLYYSLSATELVFASEPRAILKALGGERSVDRQSAVQFLRRGFSYGEQSVWTGIRRIPPAGLLSYVPNGGRSETRRYWVRPVGTVDRRFEDAVDEAEHLLDSAVEEQLVADVPVGCFLSGGLDSSLITSFAANHVHGIRSFFADFPGWSGSERDDAALVAGHVGTNHIVEEVLATSLGREQSDDAVAALRAYDEPIADLSVIPTWFLSRAMSRHVKVALSGDGGDELFAGYSRYANPIGTPRRRIAWLLEGVRRNLGIGRQWPEGCANASEYYHLQMCPSFTSDEISRLFPDWLGSNIADNPEIPIGMSNAGLRPRDCQEWDLDSYTVDSNLARMDRGSMAHGLEVRVPMFDHRLVELALSLPQDLNPAGSGGKRVLRQIAQRRLPAASLNKPKQGFSFPLSRFVSMETMVQSVMHGRLVRERILSLPALKTWLALPPRTNQQLKLWLLYVLDHWAEYWVYQDGSH